MEAALVYDPGLETYRFGGGHPMRPERFSLAVELMRGWQLLEEAPVDRAGLTPTTPKGPRDRAAVWRPEPATDDDLLLAHSPELIAAVRNASATPSRADPRHGLGPGDTPAFPGMHEAAALAVGATLLATRSVLGGPVLRAFNPGGGLHHAHRDRAAGFCIYNDCTIALSRATLENRGLRIAYVDIDAHHGDGVQEAFYDRPDVLTLSIHESGSYLYPGTGHDRDIGEGPGSGFALNVPLPPFADDGCYAVVLRDVVAPALRAFEPDLLFVQGGADTHRDDPLTHLDMTVAGYARLVGGLVELAGELCGGRIVMTGGGGYEAFSAVPRMWACAMAALFGVEPPATVPADWLAAVREHVPAASEATFGERSASPAADATDEALRLTRRVCEQLASNHPLLRG